MKSREEEIREALKEASAMIKKLDTAGKTDMDKMDDFFRNEGKSIIDTLRSKGVSVAELEKYHFVTALIVFGRVL